MIITFFCSGLLTHGAVTLVLINWRHYSTKHSNRYAQNNSQLSRRHNGGGRVTDSCATVECRGNRCWQGGGAVCSALRTQGHQMMQWQVTYSMGTDCRSVLYQRHAASLAVTTILWWEGNSHLGDWICSCSQPHHLRVYSQVLCTLQCQHAEVKDR